MRLACIGLVVQACVSAATLFNVPPAGIQVTEFTNGQNFPTSMTELPDGSLLVGTTTPAGTGDFTNFYFGSGNVTRFTQSGGVATGSPAVVVSGLPGAVSSVRQLGDVIAVSTAGDGTFGGLDSADIFFFRQGVDPTAPYTAAGSIHFTYPVTDAAISMTLASRPGGAPGTYELYFGLQAGENTATPVGNVAMSGMVNGSLPAGSLYRMIVDTSGPSVTAQAPQQLADGLRNTAGIIVDSSGNIYFGDNGYEDANGAGVSADELNLLLAAQIGAVQSYGYPGSYTNPGTGVFVGGGGIPALAAFLEANGITPVGAAEIAFAPAFFPSGLNNGIFIGFHGNFYTAGPGNVGNPLLYYSFDTGTYSTFFAGGLPGVGHLDSLWSTPTALYIGDFSSGDGFPGGAGVIYKLTATAPEPASYFLCLAGLGVLAVAKLRRGNGRPERPPQPH